MARRGQAVDAPFEPEPLYVLSDPEQLRVVANPLRRRILDCLIPAEHPIKEIGELLGIGSNTLYYHVAALERSGLIRHTRTEPKAGVEQKRYRASARYFKIAADLLHHDGEDPRRDPGTVVVGAVEDSARNLRDAFEAGLVDRWTDVVLVGRRTARLSPERALLFRQRLATLIQDFFATDQRDGGLQMEFAYATFPRVGSDAPPDRPSIDGAEAAEPWPTGGRPVGHR